MRALLAIVSAATLMIGPAVAQNQNPPAKSGPGNAAVNSSSKPNDPAPVEGANSFTEGQAKSKIETNGFTNVSALKKDNDGVWRGKAQKGGTPMDVSVDFKGNVVAK